MNFLKTMFVGTGLNADEAKARLDNGSAPFILDVRETHEFTAGHIPNSRLIPLQELRNRMEELPTDREILCVCRSGARSSMAVRALNSAGYNAVNLDSGMIGWQRAGYPVKKGRS